MLMKPQYLLHLMIFSVLVCSSATAQRGGPWWNGLANHLKIVLAPADDSNWTELNWLKAQQGNPDEFVDELKDRRAALLKFRSELRDARRDYPKIAKKQAIEIAELESYADQCETQIAAWDAKLKPLLDLRGAEVSKAEASRDKQKDLVLAWTKSNFPEASKVEASGEFVFLIENVYRAGDRLYLPVHLWALPGTSVFIDQMHIYVDQRHLGNPDLVIDHDGWFLRERYFRENTDSSTSPKAIASADKSDMVEEYFSLWIYNTSALGSFDSVNLLATGSSRLAADLWNPRDIQISGSLSVKNLPPPSSYTTLCVRKSVLGPPYKDRTGLPIEVQVTDPAGVKFVPRNPDLFRSRIGFTITSFDYSFSTLQPKRGGTNSPTQQRVATTKSATSEAVSGMRRIVGKRRGNHLYIPAVIQFDGGGTLQCELMLDTGASVSAIPQSSYAQYAKRDVAALKTQSFTTANGVIKVPITGGEISIGGLRRNVTVSLPQSDAYLLGMEFFATGAFTIDLANECVYVTN